MSESDNNLNVTSNEESNTTIPAEKDSSTDVSSNFEALQISDEMTAGFSSGSTMDSSIETIVESNNVCKTNASVNEDELKDAQSNKQYLKDALTPGKSDHKKEIPAEKIKSSESEFTKSNSNALPSSSVPQSMLVTPTAVSTTNFLPSRMYNSVRQSSSKNPYADVRSRVSAEPKNIATSSSAATSSRTKTSLSGNITSSGSGHITNSSSGRSSQRGSISSSSTSSGLVPRERRTIVRPSPHVVIEEMRQYYENEIAVLRRQLSLATNRSEMPESEEALLERCSQLETEYQRSQNKIENLEEQVNGLRIQLETYPSRVAELEDDNSSLRSRIDDIRGNNQRKQQEIDELHEIVRNLETKLCSQENSPQQERIMFQRLIEEYDILVKDYEGMKREMASVKRREYDAKLEIGELKKRLNNQSQKVTMLDEENQYLRQQRRNMAEAAAAAAERSDSERSRYYADFTASDRDESLDNYLNPRSPPEHHRSSYMDLNEKFDSTDEDPFNPSGTSQIPSSNSMMTMSCYGALASGGSPGGHSTGSGGSGRREKLHPSSKISNQQPNISEADETNLDESEQLAQSGGRAEGIESDSTPGKHLDAGGKGSPATLGRKNFFRNSPATASMSTLASKREHRLSIGGFEEQRTSGVGRPGTVMGFLNNRIMKNAEQPATEKPMSFRGHGYHLHSHMDPMRTSFIQPSSSSLAASNPSASRQQWMHSRTSTDYGFNPIETNKPNQTPELTSDIKDLERQYDQMQTEKQNIQRELSHLPTKSLARNRRQNQQQKELLETQLDAIDRDLGLIRMHLKKMNVIK